MLRVQKANQSVLREIRVQTDPTAETRTETYMGREYLVAPIVMLVEGVVQGANVGVPELVPAETLEAFAHSWNGRPVVMNHPQVQGTYVSANDPEVLEAWAFGFVFNSYFDDAKLKAEAWIDTARALELGGDFQDAVDRINAGDMVEISTGLFVNTADKKGRFNNKDYKAVWVGPLISDHLAILSAGIIGACSVEGGCGIPRINQETKGPWGDRPAEMRLNTAALRTFSPSDESHDGHCCETCKGAAVVNMKPGKPDKSDEAEAEDDPSVMAAVELVEPTVEELAVLQARAEIMVNSIPDTLTNEDAAKLVRAALANKVGKTYVWIQAMTRDQVVYEGYSDSYCCGGSGYKSYSIGYSIGDDNAVTFIGEPQEVVLTTKITPVVNDAGGASSASSTLAVNSGEDPMSLGSGQDKPAGTSVPVTPDPALAVDGAGVQVNAAAAAVEQPKVQMSVDAWLNDAPPEVAAVIRANMNQNAARKAELITAIKANAANTFSDEQLNAMDNGMLEGISKLSVNAQPADEDDRAFGSARLNYGGRGGLGTSSDSVSEEEQQRINADTNGRGAPKAPSIFAAADSFGTRVGAFKQ